MEIFWKFCIIEIRICGFFYIFVRIFGDLYAARCEYSRVFSDLTRCQYFTLLVKV